MGFLASSCTLGTMIDLPKLTAVVAVGSDDPSFSMAPDLEELAGQVDDLSTSASLDYSSFSVQPT